MIRVTVDGPGMLAVADDQGEMVIHSVPVIIESCDV